MLAIWELGMFFPTRLGIVFVKHGFYFDLPPPKTNMSHENQWLENVFHIEIVPF